VRAWATLLTQPGYLVGVRALQASLRRVGSAYPLVVAVTAGVGPQDRAVLEADGCLLREVEPLRPPRGLADRYANARFAEVWTKLGVWRMTEFQRLVVLDADMLVTQNMDELFDLALDDDQIAACHACRCNPNRIASYPPTWTPAGCAYTFASRTGPETDVEVPDPYFNGGILVLRPDLATFHALVAELGSVQDLSRYVFAEQDFLNEHFRGRWVVLPYVYNALKTLPFQHPEVWDDAAVKNIHFIIDKPWESPLDPASRYHDLEQLWWDVAADLVPGPQPAGV
jgi:alpha-N-acetylglucosamine transferase